MGSASQPRHAAFRVLADDVDRRVDRVVRRLLPQVPLARLHRALREGDVRVNGARVTPATRTRQADLISVSAALAATRARHQPRPAPLPRSAHRAPLAELYRDRHVVAIDKPAGLAVHGGADSVMARLAAVVPQRPAALSFAPAPVHQLDRITSGVLVIARTLAAARGWATALRTGATVKLYLAVVEGDLRRSVEGAMWEDTLRYDRRRRRAVADPAGSYASARVWALATAAGAPPCTLLLVHLRTGRRHQIRAQAALRGHPLIGDARYGSRCADAAGWPLLHAAAIRHDLPHRHDQAGHSPPILAPLPAPARRSLERRFGRGTAARAATAVAARMGAAAPPGAPPHPALQADHRRRDPERRAAAHRRGNGARPSRPPPRRPGNSARPAFPGQEARSG